MTDRKNLGVAFWTTLVVVVALVGYPLSIGPYLWLSDVLSVRARTSSAGTWRTAYSALVFIDPVYDPLRWIMERSDVADSEGNTYISMWRIAKSK